jgi:hypothetical protein
MNISVTGQEKGDLLIQVTYSWNIVESGIKHHKLNQTKLLTSSELLIFIGHTMVVSIITLCFWYHDGPPI